MGETDGDDFMEILEYWLERFVLIPQRYLEAAPRMLLIFQKRISDTWTYHILFVHYFFAKKISFVFSFCKGGNIVLVRENHSYNTYKLCFLCTLPTFLETIILRTVKLSSFNLIGGDHLVPLHQKTLF